jgi:hypothetical protein
MKALTIRQPWASLIALGVKHIETRSWSTRYRGPLAIHAGVRYDPFVPEDPERRLWASCSRVLIEPKIGNEDTWKHGNPFHHLPFGAVVAVADLVDVVPMIDGSLGWTEDSDTPPAALVLSWDTSAMLVDTRATGPFPDYSDQLPYGDFSPGRYAWLLDNVRPIDPVPAKGRQGLWTPDAALAEALR